METLIPAWTYRQIWQRHERFRRKKQLDPFTNVALAVWTYDISVEHDDELAIAPEVEIVDDILRAAERRG